MPVKESQLYNTNAQTLTMNQQFKAGDKVVFTAGRFEGRTGEFVKYCSSVFPEKCRVTLDLKGKQRTRETVMEDWENLQRIDQSKTSTMSTDFKTIPLAAIRPDENQPRKIYDETSMQELVASVKEKGVLQPILIRPVALNGKNKELKVQTYKLVCGERRYRASKEAGLEEIPAVIRTLTDEEALELQIIENLQRKDVHPMEEAVAFKSLQQRFSVEEIAHRVGKAASFVAQRIALTNLIETFQELLFAGALALKDAIRLCRLETSAQQSILKECNVPKDWKKRKDYQINYLINYIDRSTHDLSSASFKTEDPDLYPEMGACGTCRFNSAANKTLFPELNKKRICHNGVCYQIKSSRSYQQSIEKVLQDPSVYFICSNNYPYSEDKAKIKAVEDMGAMVLMPDQFEILQKPEPVATWEEYLKENDHWSDDEDYSAEEKKEAEADCRDDYAIECRDYEEELKAYQDAIAKGLGKKAFVVVGGWKAKEGAIVDIVLKAKKGAKLELNESAPASQQQLQIETEIAGINEREARNKELDREKIFRRLMELFNLEGNDFLTSTDELSPDEWAAALFALCDASHKVRNYVDEALKVSDSWEGLKRYKAIAKNQDVTILYKAIRLFLYDKLINPNECDYGKRGKPAAMFEIGKQYFKSELAHLELEQKEKAAKRSANVEKRLEALEAKKQELQATATPNDKPSKKAKGVKA